MNLLDAAAFHLVVLQADHDPRLPRYQRLEGAFLSALRARGIPHELEALTAENVDDVATASGLGQDMRLGIWSWAEFLTREGLLDQNPLEGGRR